MMWHLLGTVPNKHVFLHLENKIFRLGHLCSTTEPHYNGVDVPVFGPWIPCLYCKVYQYWQMWTQKHNNKAAELEGQSSLPNSSDKQSKPGSQSHRSNKSNKGQVENAGRVKNRRSEKKTNRENNTGWLDDNTQDNLAQGKGRWTSIHIKRGWRGNKPQVRRWAGKTRWRWWAEFVMWVSDEI